MIQIITPSETSFWTSFWTAASPIATIIVAFIGWVIVERFARQRERREDLRTLHSNFVESIARLNRDAIEFYKTDGSDARAKTLSIGIKAKIAALADQLIVLRAGKLEIEADAELLALRRIITGGAFDSALRPAIADDAKLMHLIAGACEDMELKVTAAYYRSLILSAKQRKKLES